MSFRKNLLSRIIQRIPIVWWPVVVLTFIWIYSMLESWIDQTLCLHLIYHRRLLGSLYTVVIITFCFPEMTYDLVMVGVDLLMVGVDLMKQAFIVFDVNFSLLVIEIYECEGSRVFRRYLWIFRRYLWPQNFQIVMNRTIGFEFGNKIVIPFCREVWDTVLVLRREIIKSRILVRIWKKIREYLFW